MGDLIERAIFIWGCVLVATGVVVGVLITKGCN